MKLCQLCKRSYRDDSQNCPFDGNELKLISDPLIGALINEKYVLEDLIGEGASSCVYKATRLLIGQEVAVKILNYPVQATSPSLHKFFREVAATSRIRHQNIVTVFESGLTDDSNPFMVMEYLEGNTLARVLAENESMPINRVIDLIGQISQGLACAHEATIIHKDIKPANVLLCSTRNNNDFVKIVDFGIADLYDENLTRQTNGKIVGSPAYMSPEQCRGLELDFKTDIYAMGVLTFELLTGKRPYTANDINKLLQMHINSPIPNICEIDSKFKNYLLLNDVLVKALSKNKNDRQNSVLEFFSQLEESIKAPTPTYGKLNSPKAERDRKIGNTGTNEDFSDNYTLDYFDIPVEERLIEVSNPVSTIEYQSTDVSVHEGIEVSKIMREIIVQAKHNKNDEEVVKPKPEIDMAKTISATPNENVIHELANKLDLKQLHQTEDTHEQLKQWHANKINSHTNPNAIKKPFQHEIKGKPNYSQLVLMFLFGLILVILKFVFHYF